ncbi:M23 family metallopeptidase [Phenylobacterium deserti]|uniref:M23 family peptidase n=1 Tax=Phenylobacterium deserti TaxID=1914756 RepID=A0A328A8S9_9CAUL|nr:M23 family metallopeptidase [Phenylobacterium deserti]RAK50895.1 M23 family peptidase [Phenylobacterium deserti]
MRITHLALFAMLAVGGTALAQAAPQGPRLGFPVACEIGRTCEVQNYVDRDPGPGARDYRCATRTYQGHSGVDIRLLDLPAQKRGVEVLAAAPGRVSRLRNDVADVSVRAAGVASVAGRECGNGLVIDHGGGWETQYCHMAQGSIRVKAGDVVTAGQPLGRVGLSGQTEYPHLHMTVRHQGRTVDPFAPNPASAASCTAQQPMWTPAAAKALTYKAGAILNAGFAGAALTLDQIESGTMTRLAAGAPYMVAYMRAVGLERGDELEVILTAPGGSQLAAGKSKPMDGPKAHWFQMVGKRTPPGGWPSGAYTAETRVWRGGKVVLTRRETTRM